MGPLPQDRLGLLGFEQGYFPFAVPPSTAGSTGLGYPKGVAIPILRKGRIWMAYDGGGTPLHLAGEEERRQGD